MSNYNSIPIIRVQLERATHAIMVAVNEEMLKMGDEMKVAVESVCTPENVKRIVGQAVDSTLKEAINETVRDYFRYGKGREALKKAVELQLGEDNGK